MKSSEYSEITTKLLFRLLPFQILLAVVGAVNGIISSFFASNYVGMHAMSAVGLYAPLNMLLAALSTMLVGGASILCGKYIGQNQQEKLQNAFSLDLLLSMLLAILFTILFLVMGALDLTGFLTRDEAVRPLLNRYLIGQSIGVIPFVLSSQLTAFLSLENRGKRTSIASLVYILTNLVLNFVFVQVLHLEAFGLALASSIGMWVFLGVQAQFFYGEIAFAFQYQEYALERRLPGYPDWFPRGGFEYISDIAGPCGKPSARRFCRERRDFGIRNG